jgi:hypothetical protein
MTRSGVYEAKQDYRSHDEECDECRELGKSGDMCPGGARLLARARRLFDEANDPPDREDD